MISTFLTYLSLSTNMNGNVYGISNPDVGSGVFKAEFNMINASSEYFDVYSHPITSKYGEVYWTMMEPVNLPETIVQRVNDKTIAIVGYEVDQVFLNADGSESPVPITWAYNHHYEAYLRNGKASIMQINPNLRDQTDIGQFNHGQKAEWKIRNFSETSQNSLFFSEANGGEFRASFHGYPNGYAQLLDSPLYFDLQPMQIDTRNRAPQYINNSIFHPSILPKNAAAPPDAYYSGLLECPCTTRIQKQINHFYNNLVDGSCAISVLNSDECYSLAVQRGQLSSRANYSIRDTHSPYGCFFNKTGTYVNLYRNPTVNCGNSQSTIEGWMHDNATGISLTLQIHNNSTFMNFTGPAEVWYGVAFGATSMKDLPYSIIVQGDGTVLEQKLGNHGPGTRLNQSIKIISQTVRNGQRTVFVEKQTNSYYDFGSTVSDINVLVAYGNGKKFSYHRGKGTNQVLVKVQKGNTCICDDGKKGTINGIRFQKNCRPEPYGDLIRQHNPSCFIETYQGGLSCCHHKWVLLDADQEQPVEEMTYHLKFRFWFQEYSTQISMIRAYYQTEAFSGEYDVPRCAPGTPPEERIHTITAHWQVNEMVSKEFQEISNQFALIYAGPHCHAPTCIDMELYNSDTGDLLCHVDGILGSGNQSKPYDEHGYIKLNPCLWGEDSGLIRPIPLSWNTNLTSIKRANNTYAHYGEMASWQMRGIVI